MSFILTTTPSGIAAERRDVKAVPSSLTAMLREEIACVKAHDLAPCAASSKLCSFIPEFT